MSRYFQWWILYLLTGSPVLSIVLIVLFWWSADRLTLRLLPSPMRMFFRWRRVRFLRETLHSNPHDRRARFELAEILIGQRRFAAAVDVLKPNVEFDQDDPGTLFAMGVACFGSARAEQGEVFFEAARAIDPTFRMNAIDLELGRWRLVRGDAFRAREALDRFCAARPGTVEGKVLLARAHDAMDDGTAAANIRELAWTDYVNAPGFQRRQERLWAWRANPMRPLTYACAALACGFILARVAMPYVQHMAEGRADRAQYLSPR